MSCAPAASGGEQFVAHRIVNHGHFSAAFDAYGDGNGEMRETFDEVCSAIQWINHPLHIAIFADQLTAFFAHDTVLRIRLADDVDDQMLCIAIDVGDEVIGPFLARFYSVRGFVVFGNQVTGLARSARR